MEMDCSEDKMKKNYGSGQSIVGDNQFADAENYLKNKEKFNKSEADHLKAQRYKGKYDGGT